MGMKPTGSKKLRGRPLPIAIPYPYPVATLETITALRWIIGMPMGLICVRTERR